MATTITKNITIDTLTQYSQLVFDQLNREGEPMVVINGDLVLGVLLPANNFTSEQEKRLELVKKEVEESDEMLQKIWGDTNKNTHYSADEVDKFSF